MPVHQPEMTQKIHEKSSAPPSYASVNAPLVAAVVPLITPVIPLASNLYQDEYLDAAKAESFVVRTEKVHLARLDDPANPLVKIGPDGTPTLFALWAHPKDYVDSNFIVAMVCPLSRDAEGKPMFKPSVIMRGPLANVMIVGGMGCCGAALQTHWSQILDDGAAPLDDPRLPLAGLKHQEHANWLKGRIHVAQGPEGLAALNHMAFDMLAHRLPDDPRFNHACASQQDYVAYSAVARRHTLG